MAVQQLDRMAERIGRDLHPDAAARAAIRCDHATDGIAQLLEHLDVVAKTEHHGLERRAPDVTERVVQPEPDQRAAGVRVVDRGLLAEEVRQAGSARRRRAAAAAANRSRR